MLLTLWHGPPTSNRPHLALEGVYIVQRITVVPCLVVCLLAARSACSAAEPLVEAVDRVKPAVVAVGVFKKQPVPMVRLLATGFVVDAEGHVVTNAHVTEQLKRHGKPDTFHVFFSDRPLGRGLPVELVIEDKVHDLAVLKIKADKPDKLTTVEVARTHRTKLGQTVGVYGFPMGGTIGLHGSVGHGIVSSIAPVALPGRKAADGSSAPVRRTPHKVLHLDLRALPGNSGSPVFRVSDGKVIGIVSMIAGVKTGDNAPATGITYAVGVDHVQTLLKRVHEMNDH